MKKVVLILTALILLLSTSKVEGRTNLFEVSPQLTLMESDIPSANLETLNNILNWHL